MKKKRTGKFLVYLTIAFLVLLFISLGKGYMWWQQIYFAENGSYTDPDIDYSDDNGDEKEKKIDEPTIVMALGLDQRANSPTRADTIMLFSMDWQTENLNIISIPRDLRVNIPGRGLDKINHAQAYVGTALTRKTIEEFLGIKIDNYMTTNFSGFENIIDLLGGVELEVEQRMRYYGCDVTIELDPGLQRLDGDKSLQYVRYRSDAAGDLGRMERQQRFLKTLIDEAYAFRTVFRIPQILDELAKNFRTDMELREMKSFISRVQSMELNEVESVTIPGSPRMINGVSYIVPDEAEVEKLVKEYILWETNQVNTQANN